MINIEVMQGTAATVQGEFCWSSLYLGTSNLL